MMIQDRMKQLQRDDERKRRKAKGMELVKRDLLDLKLELMLEGEEFAEITEQDFNPMFIHED